MTETLVAQSVRRDDDSESSRARVVIIGGGFAGVAAARALRRSACEVILIDRRNHHIFQPLLYQVATAVLAPSDVSAPLRQLTRNQANLSVLLAEVLNVNLGGAVRGCVSRRIAAKNCHI
jgi:NADH:ubiquinone reductase (H+-translocating)